MRLILHMANLEVSSLSCSGDITWGEKF